MITCLVIIVFMLAAFFMSLVEFCKIAKDKGHKKTAAIWIFGIFLTPIVAGIYTIALPDRSTAPASQSYTAAQQQIQAWQQQQAAQQARAAQYAQYQQQQQQQQNGAGQR